LCPVIHRSLNKTDNCSPERWSGNKIKLQEGAINGILVADTDSVSGAEATYVEDYFEEDEDEDEEEEGGEGEEEQKVAVQEVRVRR